MAGGREGSTRDGNDPWKEREVIGTQQRPGFRVRILLLSYLKEKEGLEGFGGLEEVGGLEEQQAAAALHSTNFPLLISDISG